MSSLWEPLFSQPVSNRPSCKYIVVEKIALISEPFQTCNCEWMFELFLDSGYVQELKYESLENLTKDYEKLVSLFNVKE